MKVRIDSINGDKITVIFYTNHEFCGRMDVTKKMFTKFCSGFNIKPKFYEDWEASLI